jgi:hypothetical protein
MTEPIITEEQGYGFSLTRFLGLGGQRMYQLNEGTRFVQLMGEQIISLAFALVHHISRGTFGKGKT